MRRLGAFLLVIAIVCGFQFVTAGPQAFADPAIPAVPFQIDGNGNPKGSVWDDAHYVMAAGWIVGVAAVPNNKVQGQSDAVTAMAHTIVTAGTAHDVPKGKVDDLTLAYDIGVSNLHLGQQFGGKKWWDYVLSSIGINCTDTEPTPQMPGRGVSGWFDGGTTKPGTGAVTPTTVYRTMGYPPRWHTYGLGCGGKTIDGGAEIDTFIGNLEMGVATTLVAVSNSLTRVVRQPTFLKALDPLVIDGTNAVKRSLYTPYVGLILLIVAVSIMVTARRASMHEATTLAMWALLMLGVIATVIYYPAQSASWSDSFTIAATTTVDDNTLGTTPAGGDPAASTAELLTDNVLVKPWLRGELGSTDSDVAKKYGMLLFSAQHYSYAEARIVQTDPTAGARITKTKRDDFNKLAQAICAEDPAACQTLKGTGDSRAAYGLVAVVAALLTVPFLLLASLLTLACFLIQRALVMTAPAVGAVSLHHRLRHFAYAAFTIAFASVVNTVIFTGGAALNVLAVGYLLGGTVALPEWLAFLVCGMFTWILMHILRPFRTLTRLVRPSQVTNAASDGASLKGPRRAAKKIAGIAAGVSIGEKLAGHGDDAEPEAPARAVPDTVPEEWTRQGATRPARPPVERRPSMAPLPEVPDYAAIYADQDATDPTVRLPRYQEGGPEIALTEWLPRIPTEDAWDWGDTGHTPHRVYRIWDAETSQYKDRERGDVDA